MGGEACGGGGRSDLEEDSADHASDVLEIRIVHGSLEFATDPVAVGHYQGMPINGAEGFLNQKLGGLLADRLLLGVYAEEEGSAVLVGPLPGTKPPGGLVLGLGPAGEVTTGKVARAMTQAVLKRSLAAAEEHADPTGGPKTIGISSVLVGTSPLDGMTVAASVAALIDGVLEAIQLVRRNPRLWRKVRIGSLEIIERYEQRAVSAHRAIEASAKRDAPRSAEIALRVSDELIGGEALGGLPGQPQDDYIEQAWWRLDIRSAPKHSDLPDGYRDIEFTSMARRARADRLVQRTEVSLVNDLIARAVGQANPDTQVCNTLYELLIPGELKYELFNADNLHLLLDSDTACYPWEALAPRYRAGDKALASRTGLLRQFAEPETRLARFGVRRASGRDVLVIGNPPAGTHGPSLLGAADEAQQVADFFATKRDEASDHAVHALIWGEEGAEATGLPPADDAQGWVHVVNALYRHEYRIIHIAAHGVFNSQDPSRSGVVIGEDHFLTALTVNQLPVVPELVFLNCCHSGRMGDLPGISNPERQVNLLAASVARRLMGIGVRAVIAAGWAVDDTAAALFATTFYHSAVAEGCAFGDAVRKARETVKAASDSLTWAAYQCYGDPEFRLQASSDW